MILIKLLFLIFGTLLESTKLVLIKLHRHKKCFILASLYQKWNFFLVRLYKNLMLIYVFILTAWRSYSACRFTIRSVLRSRLIFRRTLNHWVYFLRNYSELVWALRAVKTALNFMSFTTYIVNAVLSLILLWTFL